MINNIKHYVLIFFCTFSVTALADSQEQVGSPKQQPDRDTGPLKMMSGNTTWHNVLKEAFETAGTTDFTENRRKTIYLLTTTVFEQKQYTRPPEFVMRNVHGEAADWIYSSSLSGRCFSTRNQNYAQNSVVTSITDNKFLGVGQGPIFKAMVFNNYEQPANYYDDPKNVNREEQNGLDLWRYSYDNMPMFALEEDGPYVRDSRIDSNIKYTFRTGATKLAPNDEYILVEAVDLELDNAVKKYCYYFKQVAAMSW